MREGLERIAASGAALRDGLRADAQDRATGSQVSGDLHDPPPHQHILSDEARESHRILAHISQSSSTSTDEVLEVARLDLALRELESSQNAIADDKALAFDLHQWIQAMDDAFRGFGSFDKATQRVQAADLSLGLQSLPDVQSQMHRIGDIEQECTSAIGFLDFLTIFANFVLNAGPDDLFTISYITDVITQVQRIYTQEQEAFEIADQESGGVSSLGRGVSVSARQRRLDLTNSLRAKIAALIDRCGDLLESRLLGSDVEHEVARQQLKRQYSDIDPALAQDRIIEQQLRRYRGRRSKLIRKAAKHACKATYTADDLAREIFHAVKRQGEIAFGDTKVDYSSIAIFLQNIATPGSSDGLQVQNIEMIQTYLKFSRRLCAAALQQSVSDQLPIFRADDFFSLVQLPEVRAGILLQYVRAQEESRVYEIENRDADGEVIRDKKAYEGSSRTDSASPKRTQHEIDQAVARLHQVPERRHQKRQQNEEDDDDAVHGAHALRRTRSKIMASAIRLHAADNDRRQRLKAKGDHSDNDLARLKPKQVTQHQTEVLVARLHGKQPTSFRQLQQNSATVLQAVCRMYFVRNSDDVLQRMFEYRQTMAPVVKPLRDGQSSEAARHQQLSEAAIRVQSGYRGYVGRSSAAALRADQVAATTIQSICRARVELRRYRSRQEHARTSEAVTLLQAVWRGHAATEQLRLQRQSAITIQRRVRLWTVQIVRQREENKQYCAARTIQASWRGKLVRQSRLQFIDGGIEWSTDWEDRGNANHDVVAPKTDSRVYIVPHTDKPVTRVQWFQSTPHGDSVLKSEDSSMWINVNSDNELGSYYCIAHNSDWSIRSRSVVVRRPERIAVVPLKLISNPIKQGEPFLLSVAATGEPPLHFQWLRKPTKSTKKQFKLKGDQHQWGAAQAHRVNHAGTYSVRIWNRFEEAPICLVAEVEVKSGKERHLRPIDEVSLNVGGGFEYLGSFLNREYQEFRTAESRVLRRTFREHQLAGTTAIAFLKHLSSAKNAKRTKQFVHKILEVELNDRKTDVAKLKGSTSNVQRLPIDGERLAAVLTPTTRLMVDLDLMALDNAALGSREWSSSEPEPQLELEPSPESEGTESSS
jgi:hypothetical protein